MSLHTSFHITPSFCIGGSHWEAAQLFQLLLVFCGLSRTCAVCSGSCRDHLGKQGVHEKLASAGGCAWDLGEAGLCGVSPMFMNPRGPLSSVSAEDWAMCLRASHETFLCAASWRAVPGRDVLVMAVSVVLGAGQYCWVCVSSLITIYVNLCSLISSMFNRLRGVIALPPYFGKKPEPWAVLSSMVSCGVLDAFGTCLCQQGWRVN